MRYSRLLAGMLLACLPIAVDAAPPPTQNGYQVNLGIGYSSATFVYGQVPMWIDTTNTSVAPYGLPRPASMEYPLPVQSVGAGSSSASPTYTSPPSGTLNDPSATSLSPAYTMTTAGTDYPIVPALTAGQSRKALVIFIITPGAMLYCTDLGVSSQSGGSIPFNTYLNFEQIGYLPNTAVDCQSTVANTKIAVREAH